MASSISDGILRNIGRFFGIVSEGEGLFTSSPLSFEMLGENVETSKAFLVGYGPAFGLVSFDTNTLAIIVHIYKMIFRSLDLFEKSGL